MDRADRRLTVLADGEPFAADSRFRLSGTVRIGLFPSPFLLRCWNLAESDVFRLRNTKDVSAMRDDSCLAFGQVSDVFVQTVPEGTVTSVGKRNFSFSSGGDVCFGDGVRIAFCFRHGDPASVFSGQGSGLFPGAGLLRPGGGVH